MRVLLPEAVSAHVWRYGYFEEDVCAFLLLSLIPGSTFVDIGAHFGFFSLLASELVGPRGRVVAIEAMPQTFEYLRRNLQTRAAYRNGIAVNRAAYNEDGPLTFFDYGLEHAGMNSALGWRGDAEVAGDRKVQVQGERADGIFEKLELSRVDLIKIDTESSELLVLRGLEISLLRFRPLLILEVGDFFVDGAPGSAEVVEWLVSRGYAPHEYVEGVLRPHSPQKRYGYGNLLFLPTGS